MNRRAGLLVLAVVVVVLGAYLTAARRTAGPPLDPRSTAPDGTAGLTEVLGSFAASVAILDGADGTGVPAAGVETAVLLEDRFDRDDAVALEAWVGQGGTLVVADPASTLTPPVAGVADVQDLDGRVEVTCDVTALAGVEVLSMGALARTFGGTAPGCTSRGRSVVVVTERGAGTIVAVSTPEIFTNRHLDEADNAVLAVSLLAPTGDTDVAFLAPRALPGTGDRGLLDLVDTPVWASLAQLAVAFLVVVLWRARRLGHPVEEPQPVAIAGSELTAAVGRLLATNRHPERAAALLRERTWTELAGPLGIQRDTPSEVLVEALAGSGGVDRDDARRAVLASASSDAELVALAQLLTRIRQEVLHGRRDPVHL